MRLLVEVEIGNGANWAVLCHCRSQDAADGLVQYLRPMSCFSGRKFRIRQDETPYFDLSQEGVDQEYIGEA